MADDGEPGEAVLSLLDDEYARAILVATSHESLSASALAETCGASEPTIYRRLTSLADQGLIEEQQELDPEGHHYKTYTTRVDRVTVEIDAEGYRVSLEPSAEDPADRFTRLYEGLR